MVCSKAILGAFHYRIIFRKLSESARDYNHNQLVCGVQECYGSIVVQYGNVFILVDEDYRGFAINRSWSQSYSPTSISLTKRWMRLWNEAEACLKRPAGTSENPGALWDGILCINCENSLKVFTGSRIVSPLAMV